MRWWRWRGWLRALLKPSSRRKPGPGFLTSLAEPKLGPGCRGGEESREWEVPAPKLRPSFRGVATPGNGRGRAGAAVRKQIHDVNQQEARQKKIYLAWISKTVKENNP